MNLVAMMKFMKLMTKMSGIVTGSDFFSRPTPLMRSTLLGLRSKIRWSFKWCPPSHPIQSWRPFLTLAASWSHQFYQRKLLLYLPLRMKVQSQIVSKKKKKKIFINIRFAIWRLNKYILYAKGLSKGMQATQSVKWNETYKWKDDMKHPGYEPEQLCAQG